MSLAKGELRPLVVLLTVIFLNIAGFGLVIPLLPFFGEAFHAPAWQITLLFSMFSAGQFLGEPFWGRLSDRIGRRPVLITTIAIAALLYFALAFSPNIMVALVARFAGGFFSGNISTLQSSMADITPPQQRAARMGLIGGAFSAGFMMGPAIGGLLAQPERGALGFQLPLFLAAACGLASALAVLLVVRETSPKTDAPRVAARHRLREAFRHPVISRVIPISFITISGFAGTESIFGLWTEARFGWGPRQIGVAFMLIGALGVFCQGFLTGRLVRRHGEILVISSGLTLMFVGMLTQCFAPVWEVAVVGFSLICIGQSISFPNLSGLISRSAPPGRQGEMLGLNMSSNSLARIGGPIYAGQLFSLISPGAPYILAAVLLVVAFGVAMRLRREVPLIT